jgi:hypothetical protein
MLGDLEVKKLIAFPGRCLGQQTHALVESFGDVAMLENYGTPEDA